MRLITVQDSHGYKPGALDSSGESYIDLSDLAPTMLALIENGPDALSAVADRVETGPRARLADVRLCAPLTPASLRDFLAFEDHAKGGAARRGEELNPAWYQTPIYYKGNHRQILGPDEPLAWPAWTSKLDFELELACIIGAHATGADEAEAQRMIFGYTVMNDWSARDVQRAEMAMRLGPAKSKDFATSIGPCIVTADEFDPSAGVHMRATINGDVWFETSTARMHWSFAQMIAYVSEGEAVFPGDLYGSGTAFGGCGLDQDRWLGRGDLVELWIDGIGTLRTQLT